MFWKKDQKESKVTYITDSNFNEIISNTDKGIFIDFYADWCGPCKVLAPIVEELATEFKDRVIVAKVDTEANPNLSAFFKIKSIPTIAFIKNKTVIDVLHGLVPKPNLQEMLRDLENYEFSEEDFLSEEE